MSMHAAVSANPFQGDVLVHWKKLAIEQELAPLGSETDKEPL